MGKLDFVVSACINLSLYTFFFIFFHQFSFFIEAIFFRDMLSIPTLRYNRLFLYNEKKMFFFCFHRTYTYTNIKIICYFFRVFIVEWLLHRYHFTFRCFFSLMFCSNFYSIYLFSFRALILFMSLFLDCSFFVVVYIFFSSFLFRSSDIILTACHTEWVPRTESKCRVKEKKKFCGG